MEYKYFLPTRVQIIYFPVLISNYMKEDHGSYRRNFCSCEKKGRKNSGLYGIRTLDLCNTGATLPPNELTSQLGADH